jgi:hypothetical protein
MLPCVATVGPAVLVEQLYYDNRHLHSVMKADASTIPLLQMARSRSSKSTASTKQNL